MQYRRIDLNTGMFIEDVVTDGEPTPDLIVKPCPGGFYWPRWNGKEWVEGRTAEEIEAIRSTIAVPTETERLAALESAMLDLLMGGTL